MPSPPPRLKYYDFILGSFAVVLVISNIASTKFATVTLGSWKPVFDGGTFLFPLTYIFGDILTEVYGYQRSRRVIWFALGMNLFASLIFALVGILPTDASSPTKGVFEVVLGFLPQIVAASFIAFFIGEFLNSYVLSKMKIMTNGRWLWTRTIGSTLLGQGADTLIFTFVAYGIGANAYPSDVLWNIIQTNYLYKVALEVILTPVTYVVVRGLKRAEGLDHFDHNTDFNPFKLTERPNAR